MSDNPFNASWSSKGNTLCLGHWDITYLGLPVALPIERRDKDMGTNNIYNFMDPEDELYREGLMEDELDCGKHRLAFGCFYRAQYPFRRRNHTSIL